MLEIIKAIVLGIVQGITEWLPVSSTGHMILVDEFLRLDMSAAFMDVFLVFIQLGSILAVVVVFWSYFASVFKGRREAIVLWLKVAVACVPAAVVGFLFDDRINELFFNFQTVAAALIFYGIAFIVIEHRRPEARIVELEQIGYKTALYIGMFQVLALIPGTSRSGATIIGALLVGLSRPAAAKFSFFIAVPIMLGASVLRFARFDGMFTGVETAVMSAGFITAFAVSLVAIKFLMEFVKKHTFKGFGVYRIVLGIVVLVYFWFSN